MEDSIYLKLFDIMDGNLRKHGKCLYFERQYFLQTIFLQSAQTLASMPNSLFFQSAVMLLYNQMITAADWQFIKKHELLPVGQFRQATFWYLLLHRKLYQLSTAKIFDIKPFSWHIKLAYLLLRGLYLLYIRLPFGVKQSIKRFFGRARP